MYQTWVQHVGGYTKMAATKSGPPSLRQGTFVKETRDAHPDDATTSSSGTDSSNNITFRTKSGKKLVVPVISDEEDNGGGEADTNTLQDQGKDKGTKSKTSELNRTNSKDSVTSDGSNKSETGNDSTSNRKAVLKRTNSRDNNVAGNGTYPRLPAKKDTGKIDALKRLNSKDTVTPQSTPRSNNINQSHADQSKRDQSNNSNQLNENQSKSQIDSGTDNQSKPVFGNEAAVHVGSKRRGSDEDRRKAGETSGNANINTAGKGQTKTEDRTNTAQTKQDTADNKTRAKFEDSSDNSKVSDNRQNGAVSNGSNGSTRAPVEPNTTHTDTTHNNDKSIEEEQNNTQERRDSSSDSTTAQGQQQTHKDSTQHKGNSDNTNSSAQPQDSSSAQRKQPGSASTSRSISSRHSVRAVFSKKDGEPVYSNPDIEEIPTPRPDSENTVSKPDEKDTKLKQVEASKPVSSDNKTGKSTNKPPFTTAAVHPKEKATSRQVASEMQDPESNLETVASKFWERINETEEENKRLQEDNDILQTKLRNAEDKERKVTDENELFRSEMRDLTTQYHKSKQEGYELRQQVSRISAEHKKFIEQLEVQAEGLRKDIEKGKKDIDRMEEENRQHEQHLAKLKSEHSIDIANHKTEIEKLQKSLSTKEHVEAENSELKNKVEMLDKMRQKNVAEIEKLSNSITKIRGEMEMLKAENEKLKAEKTTKGDAEAELQKSLTEMEQLYDKMLKAKLKAESAQRALETEVDLMRKEKEFATWDQERLKQQIEDLQKRIAEMKSTEDHMSKRIKDKQQHIEDLQAQIVELRNANNRQLEEIKDMRDENKNGEIQSSKYEEIQKAHRKLLDENKRLRTQLAHKTIMETNNDTLRDDLSSRLEQTEDKLEEARKRIKTMEGWLDDIYTNKNMLGAEFPSHVSTVSLPELAHSVISEPSPRPQKPKKTIGYGISYAERLKNKRK